MLEGVRGQGARVRGRVGGGLLSAVVTRTAIVHAPTRAARCAPVRPTRHVTSFAGTATLRLRPCCAHVSLLHALRSQSRWHRHRAFSDVSIEVSVGASNSARTSFALCALWPKMMLRPCLCSRHLPDTRALGRSRFAAFRWRGCSRMKISLLAPRCDATRSNRMRMALIHTWHPHGLAVPVPSRSDRALPDRARRRRAEGTPTRRVIHRQRGRLE